MLFAFYAKLSKTLQTTQLIYGFFFKVKISYFYKFAPFKLKIVTNLGLYLQVFPSNLVFVAHLVKNRTLTFSPSVGLFADKNISCESALNTETELKQNWTISMCSSKRHLIPFSSVAQIQSFTSTFPF